MPAQSALSRPTMTPTHHLQFSPILLVIYIGVISFLHMAETLGARRAVLMTGGAFAITLTAELIGVATTGVLFGNYTYSDQLGPKVLGLVPLMIPIAWLMMLYPAYETAALLLPCATTGTPRSLRALGLNAVRALTSAAAMTAWDLSLNPRMVSDGNWVWRVADPIALSRLGQPASVHLYHHVAGREHRPMSRSLPDTFFCPRRVAPQPCAGVSLVMYSVTR